MQAFAVSMRCAPTTRLADKQLLPLRVKSRSETARLNRSAIPRQQTVSLQCRRCPLCARKRPEHLQQSTFYSITSSTRSRMDCGIERFSALAVLRLITSSNLVGCSTGRSAGLAPFKILSTYVAERLIRLDEFAEYSIRPPA